MSRVIIVIPTLGNGGGERMAVTIAEHIDPTKVEILFVVLYPEQNTANERRAKEKGLKIVHLNKRQGIDISVLKPLRKLIKRFKPDVIHTHLHVVPYVLLASPRKIKKYHTVHNVAQKEAFGLRQKIQSFAFKFGNFVPVAISPLCARTIEEVYGIKQGSFPCIPNGIDIDYFTPKPCDHEGIRFVNVGRLQPQKNQALAIHAFARVHALYPDTSLEIVGEAELRGELETLVEELKLADSVFLSGLSDNVKGKLNSADIYLQSSDYEGLPVSVLEAMACGLPIISTKAGGTVDIVDHGENGFLVDIGDEEGLVQAMILLIKCEPLRRAMAKKSREKAIEYGIQVCSKRYETLFLDC